MELKLVLKVDFRENKLVNKVIMIKIYFKLIVL